LSATKFATCYAAPGTLSINLKLINQSPGQIRPGLFIDDSNREFLAQVAHSFAPKNFRWHAGGSPVFPKVLCFQWDLHSQPVGIFQAKVEMLEIHLTKLKLK
jgi:hypothetical protein